MRGDFEAFKKHADHKHLYFGELFLDTKDNKLYIGSKEEDKPYSVNLEELPDVPLKIGNISMRDGNTLESVQSLRKDWEEFLEWRAEKARSEENN